MKKYNISANLIPVIKNLYDKATNAVLFNSSIGDWFRTTVGVRQECQLSPTLFNIFLERIMTGRRSWRHWQHWRQNNHQSLLCWWHWWLSRRGRTGKISWASRQSLLWSLPVLRWWSSLLVASICSVWSSAWLCLGDWWGLLFGSSGNAAGWLSFKVSWLRTGPQG